MSKLHFSGLQPFFLPGDGTVPQVGEGDGTLCDVERPRLPCESDLAIYLTEVFFWARDFATLFGAQNQVLVFPGCKGYQADLEPKCRRHLNLEPD